MKKILLSFSLIIIIISNPNNNLYGQTGTVMETTNDDKNLFIYHLRLTPEYNTPENWSDATNSIIEDHAQFLDSLGQRGILIFAGRTEFDPGDENLFGIALIKASSLESAKKIMEKDPAVVNKIQTASIFPFRIAIWHFENLR